MIPVNVETVRALYARVIEMAWSDARCTDNVAAGAEYSTWCPTHRAKLVLRYPGGDPEDGPAEWTCMGCVRAERDAAERFGYFSESQCVTCHAPVLWCACELADAHVWPE